MLTKHVRRETIARQSLKPVETAKRVSIHVLELQNLNVMYFNYQIETIEIILFYIQYQFYSINMRLKNG